MPPVIKPFFRPEEEPFRSSFDSGANINPNRYASINESSNQRRISSSSAGYRPLLPDNTSSGKISRSNSIESGIKVSIHSNRSIQEVERNRQTHKGQADLPIQTGQINLVNNSYKTCDSGSGAVHGHKVYRYISRVDAQATDACGKVTTSSTSKLPNLNQSESKEIVSASFIKKLEEDFSRDRLAAEERHQRQLHELVANEAKVRAELVTKLTRDHEVEVEHRLESNSKHWRDIITTEVIEKVREVTDNLNKSWISRLNDTVANEGSRWSQKLKEERDCLERDHKDKMRLLKEESNNFKSKLEQHIE